LNCSSEHSAATPYVNASSRASGQKDFTKLRAWLTHAMGASVRKLRTFCGTPRSRSSKDRRSASPPSCGSIISTSFWAAPLRSSSSFCGCSFSSPSIFFTSVSSSSLYVKIFLSSVVKIFSEFKINCQVKVLEGRKGLPWCTFLCSLSCSWSSELAFSRLRRSFLRGHVSHVRSSFSLSSSL
jgi:hypothetical protein